MMNRLLEEIYTITQKWEIYPISDFVNEERIGSYNAARKIYDVISDERHSEQIELLLEPYHIPEPRNLIGEWGPYEYAIS